MSEQSVHTAIMNETEAADYLEVNPRTLYRYRKKGKLAFREKPGKGRPTIEYARADLVALKRELERGRTRSPKPAVTPAQGSSAARRVSFGLPPQEYQELADEAVKYGMGVGEYARRLAREGLESRFRSEAAEVRSEIETLKVEVNQMRLILAGAFESVLNFSGLNAEDAEAWVKENIW